MKTLMLVPAFGCSSELYDQITPELSGVEPQAIVARQSSMAACVEDLLARAPDRFIILGTSFGGRVALEVALAAPNRVKGLIVIGAGAGPVVDAAAGLKRSQRIRSGEKDNVLAEMAAIISYLPGPRGPDTRDAFLRMGSDMTTEDLALQSDALASRIDVWPRLAEIACPTLCLWGVHDQFSATSDGRRIATSVQKGTYVELPDCGHFPSLEYPTETAAAITQWLKSENLT